jgi:hypothetical protein
MRIRTRITTFIIAGVFACGAWSAPALAASSHSAACGTSKESAATAYGGEGTEITQVPCAQPGPPSTPSASSALPFTGLDVGLLIAAGAVLVAAGMVLRWRLRHGAQ